MPEAMENTDDPEESEESDQEDIFRLG